MGREKHKKFERRRRDKKFKEKFEHRRKPSSTSKGSDGRGRRRSDFRDDAFAETADTKTDAVVLRRMAPDKLRQVAVDSQARIRHLLGLPPTQPLRPSSVEGAASIPPLRREPAAEAKLRSATPAPQTEASHGGATLPFLQPSRSYLASTQKNAKPQASPHKSEKTDFKISKLMSDLPKATDKSAQAPATAATPATAAPHLDPWQAEALEALLRGANVVVDAPTSAGKTRVIEALLDAKFKQKEPVRLIYTTPVKSLSNDKYREFCEKYGTDKIGINTGDFKENLGAPIIIATLETYRNSLLGVEPNMKRMIVVYDEYHYLQDEGRGSAWEESIILTPKESQLVLLSASVPNAEDFADWIGKLSQKECKVIRVSKRPVPLVDVVYVDQNWMLAEDLKLTEDELFELKRNNRAQSKRRRRDRNAYDPFMVPLSKALELGLGPVVVYCGRRADVETVAHSLARHLRVEYSGQEATKLAERLKNLAGWEYVPHDLQRLVKRFGIAYHHSGMIPPGRVAIESLLKEGLLRVCCGTMGISLGVNFAVRSAMIADESRPGEMGEVHYSNSEVLQMLGRAGRRGHDKQGFCLWINLGRYAEQRPREREPTRSSLRFDPTTVLGILGQYESLAYLSEFYRKSFFMRGKGQNEVVIEDQDLLSAALYKKGIDEMACDDIPATYLQFEKSRERQKTLCMRCPARTECHALLEAARRSPLQSIVRHLHKIEAVDGPVPTEFGQVARYFPQAGGLIVAKLLSTGDIRPNNFKRYTELMAGFCSAHFKKIPDVYCDTNFLESLKIPKLIEKYYPESLFPDLYDDADFRAPGKKVFREFNMGAASIVTEWLDEKTRWDELVRDHSSRHFSAGDCMMVLFRFSTFLQSCIRLSDRYPEIASQAQTLLRRLLRDPLDVRNRMIAEELEELEEFDDSETESGVLENVINKEQLE